MDEQFKMPLIGDDAPAFTAVTTQGKILCTLILPG